MPASVAASPLQRADRLEASATHVEVLSGSSAIIAPIADEWRGLCIRASDREAFYRPEWFETWLRAFAPDAAVTVLAARTTDRLVGVLPLITRRERVGGLRARHAVSPTNYHSCRFDLLRENSPAGEAAIQAIWDALARTAGWDCLEFSYVPEGGALESLSAVAAAAGYPVWKRPAWDNAYIPTGDWDGTQDYWLKRSSGHKFEQNIRRLRRKCESECPIRLERVDDANPLALEKFFELESAGWKGGSGTGIKAHPETLRFYHQIAREATRCGYSTIYFLYLGEKLAAAQFGFRYNGKFLAAKCAFDESLRALSPGHLIVDAILRDCGASKLREFELGGEFEEWKAKWTSLARAHSSLFIFRDNVYGRLMHLSRSKLIPAGGRLVRRLQRFWRRPAR